MYIYLLLSFFGQQRICDSLSRDAISGYQSKRYHWIVFKMYCYNFVQLVIPNFSSFSPQKLKKPALSLLSFSLFFTAALTSPMARSGQATQVRCPPGVGDFAIAERRTGGGGAAVLQVRGGFAGRVGGRFMGRRRGWGCSWIHCSRPWSGE